VQYCRVHMVACHRFDIGELIKVEDTTSPWYCAGVTWWADFKSVDMILFLPSHEALAYCMSGTSPFPWKTQMELVYSFFFCCFMCKRWQHDFWLRESEYEFAACSAEFEIENNRHKCNVSTESVPHHNIIQYTNKTICNSQILKKLPYLHRVI
jgi:hypothetical protein